MASIKSDSKQNKCILFLTSKTVQLTWNLKMKQKYLDQKASALQELVYGYEC